MSEAEKPALDHAVAEPLWVEDSPEYRLACEILTNCASPFMHGPQANINRALKLATKIAAAHSRTLHQRVEELQGELGEFKSAIGTARFARAQAEAQRDHLQRGCEKLVLEREAAIQATERAEARAESAERQLADLQAEHKKWVQALAAAEGQVKVLSDALRPLLQLVENMPGVKIEGIESAVRNAAAALGRAEERK